MATNEEKLAQLVTRLESVCSRFEKQCLSNGTVSTEDEEDLPPYYERFANIIGGEQFKALEGMCNFDKDLTEAFRCFKASQEALLNVLALPYECSAPDADQKVALIATSGLKDAVSKLPRPPFNPAELFVKSLNAATESSGWIFSTKPLDEFKENIGTVQFYSNKLRRDTGHSIHANSTEFATVLAALLNALVAFVSEELGNKALRWKGSKNPVEHAAKRAQKLSGAPVETKKSVAAEPAPKEAPKAQPEQKQPKVKKPIFEDYDYKEWRVGNQVGRTAESPEGLIEINIEKNHYLVSIYDCQNSTIVIHGKFNTLSVSKCDNCSVIFDSCIAEVTLMNCTKLQVQCNRTAPSICIEQSENINLHVSEDCMENAEFVTTHADTINIKPIKQEGSWAKVYPIPQTYVHTFVNGRLISKAQEGVE